MRKRNIKTIAHWVIMSVLLLFPILMVGVSSFANDEQSVTVTETYEYETNELNSVNDVVFDNIYKFVDVIDVQELDELSFDCLLIFKDKDSEMDFEMTTPDIYIDAMPLYNSIHLYANYGSYELQIGDLIFCDYGMRNTANFTNMYLTELNINDFGQIDISHLFLESDYLGDITTNVDIQNATYKQEINNWCNGFKNLPVNQWYGQLLNVIGVGQTTNSVMNVIYVYPLYVLWVYLIDLIVDCLLVIIHFGHNALSRLGGDND